MMRIAELQDLARAVAIRNGLSPSLVCALVQQESAWNQFALRYEPAFFQKYVAPLYAAGKIDVTETYSRCFSWGLMQVMGQVAREFGFEGSLGVLLDPSWGLDTGCKVLAHKLDRAKGNVEQALLAYNGGGNPNYAKQVMARIPQYEEAQQVSLNAGDL